MQESNPLTALPLKLGAPLRVYFAIRSSRFTYCFISAVTNWDATHASHSAREPTAQRTPSIHSHIDASHQLNCCLDCRLCLQSHLVYGVVQGIIPNRRYTRKQSHNCLVGNLFNQGYSGGQPTKTDQSEAKKEQHWIQRECFANSELALNHSNPA